MKMKLALLALCVGCGPVAAPTEDAGVDAAADLDTPIPAADEDGDGVPADSDCDDSDAEIGLTSSAPCTNECGEGLIVCDAGVTTACDAPTACLCDSEGATRNRDCGNCGTQPQRCEVGVWRDNGACLYEGDCVPGALEEDTSRCGLRRRLCDDECGWLPWDEIEPRGECEAGVIVSCVDGGSVRCNDICRAPSCVPIDP